MSENEIQSNFINILVQYIEEQHGSNVVVLDISKQSVIADYACITTSRNSIHAKALAERISAFLSEHDVSPIHRKRNFGEQSGWIIIDCHTIIIHIMSEEKRNFYELERLWYESPYIYGNA